MCKANIEKAEGELRKINAELIRRFLGQGRLSLARKGKSGVDEVIDSNSDLVGEFVKELSGDKPKMRYFENAVKYLATSGCMETRDPFYREVYQSGRSNLKN